MKIFLVYQNNLNLDQIKIIKSGPSITAGILNFFWAIYHSMWFIVIPIVLITIFFQITKLPIDILHTSESILFLIFAQDMLEYNLKRKGYSLKDVVFASNAEEAEYKFLTRNELNDSKV